jgi:DNA invertase Pin-like site-specific DNA recombinase
VNIIINGSHKKNIRVVYYGRISTTKQEVLNQFRQLDTLANQQNYIVLKKYIDKKTGRVTDRPQFQQMLDDARLKKFDVILIWDLYRFSREGILNTLAYIKKLRKYKVGLKSLQEPWLDTTDDGMAELLIAIFSWVGKQEAKRISERTKAGLERVKAEGKTLGRKKGSKDKKPRKKIGYLKRWEK